MSVIESFVGYNLRRAATRQRERFHSAFAPFKIRPVQFTVLAIILQNGPLRQSKLGKVLSMKGGNVVKLLDELQQRSLIERRPSKSDRRAYEVHLTAKGNGYARRLLAVHEKLEADLAQSIGDDDLKQLVELLGRLRRADSAPDLD